MSAAERSGRAGGADPLAGFSAPTRAWFAGAFESPTAAQGGAWEAIASGEHALVVAPTGSGKTLAAFLAAIDRLLTDPVPDDPTHSCRVLYVSPLKALAADVERNLRSPLVGITAAATAQATAVADVRVGVRTGDTPANERRSFGTRPPDVLITTPESLFLVLTSAARAGLAGVETVIVDEIHALAGTKRGAHLALSLERLDAMLDRPAQRVGLSATVRPVETVAAFLSGARALADGGRTTRVVQPASSKDLRIDVVVPVPDLSDIPGAPPSDDGPDLTGSAAGPLVPEQPAAGSIWPHVTERVVDLITSHSSTIVFTNSRRGAERLTARINEVQAARLAAAAEPDDEADGAGRADVDGDGGFDHGAAWPASIQAQSGAGLAVPAEAVIARAHHGSMSREERTGIESALKAGTLRSVVATSSLELGIDMGAVDLVVQVGSPPSVASALQRIGRAGHQVGATSHGVVLPTHRGDLLAAATASVRARDGHIESVRIPANPLDVLAQQVVAMVATQEWEVGALKALVRRADPFAKVSDAVVDAVLDMLAGRYPSEDFAELRPRIVWDRVADVVSGRPGALRLAATSGGTIPDRGLFGVYVVGEAAARGGRRVGELDEEMVYESRVGDTFTLGSSTWRIEDITPDRVLVSPAPGLPGRLPFWKGDAPGRPAELGAAMGVMMREVEQARFAPESLDGWGLDDWARDNLLAYLREQEQAVGRLATDKVVVVERFRDELGDWRVVVHSPFGAQVHAPWALALSARLRDRLGMDVAAMHSDDGIVLRLPDADSPWDPIVAPADDDGGSDDDARDVAGLGADDLVLDPETVSAEVVAALGGSAHFAARFREAAARSLLLPRRRPDRRQPLWQQRQRAAQLLAVAADYPDFPVVLEAVRECLQDDFDVPALARLMADIRARRVRVVEVSTPTPSPFAQSLLFGYVAQFLYEGDAPLAERRAAALTLDPSLLSDLLGEGLTDVADLLDVGALASVEAEVGLRTESTRAKDAEGVLDLVRLLGPVSTSDLSSRAVEPDAVEGWLIDLAAARRVMPVRVAGEQQWAVVEDAGRLRDALGVPLPVGLPEALLEPVPTALTDLVRRHARTHGPFRAGQVAARFGLGTGPVLTALALLADRGLLASGTLRPADAHSPESAAMPGPDYCDADVLRRIRRRSLAALRAEVEAVPPATLGLFLPRWQMIGRLRGVDGVAAAVESLAGTPVAASALESLVLPARVRDYSPDLLDELTSAGEVVWVGAGSGPGADGWVALLPADAVADLAPDLGDLVLTETHDRLLEALATGGGRFARDVVAQVQAGWPGPGEPPSGSTVVDALWDLVWAGWVTNDTLAPLRARLGDAARPGTRAPRRPRPRSLRTTALRAAALRGNGMAQPRAAAGLATPPTAVGRWSLVGERADDARRRAAAALTLLDRDGLVVRGTVPESLVGGFSTVYSVLAGAEENGQVRRGYFVEGLGAAQFALPDAVEALRTDARDVEHAPALLLAATDPANPYGAALPWPEPVGLLEERSGHRPGRKIGASVVLVGGVPVLYLERGAKTLLSFTADPARLAAASDELVRHARTGTLGRFTVSKADGGSALAAASPLTDALTTAGFIATPRGLRLRS